MKRFILFIALAAMAAIMLPTNLAFAGSGQIIATNGYNTGFSNFSAPSGQYITRLNGYWSGGWGYIDAYASGGSYGTIMVTQDAQIYLNNLTVASGKHITKIAPDGSQYLGVWTEAGLLGDVIYHSGTSYTWNFSTFSPSGEVITGFTSSSGSGWAYLTAVSSVLNNPPKTPSKPSVPMGVKTGVSATYTTSATDPNGDQVKYTFDWGDGTQTTTGFYSSGATASASHSWSAAGTYNAKVYATDSKGATSGWSVTRRVSIAGTVFQVKVGASDRTRSKYPDYKEQIYEQFVDCNTRFLNNGAGVVFNVASIYDFVGKSPAEAVKYYNNNPNDLVVLVDEDWPDSYGGGYLGESYYVIMHDLADGTNFIFSLKGTRALTHELGHYRGCEDAPWSSVSSIMNNWGTQDNFSDFHKDVLLYNGGNTRVNNVYGDNFSTDPETKYLWYGSAHSWASEQVWCASGASPYYTAMETKAFGLKDAGVQDEFTINTDVSGYGTHYIFTRVTANTDPGSANSYVGMIGSTSGNGAWDGIWKTVGGAWTKLATASYTNRPKPALKTWHTASLSTQGSTTKLYLDQVLIATASDASVTNTGDVSVQSTYGDGQMDNFRVYKWSTAKESSYNGRIGNKFPPFATNEVETGLDKPVATQLLWCVPNPTTARVNISYQLSGPSTVSLKVYNIQGHLVKTLVNEAKPAGVHRVNWDGKDEHGNKVAAGVYLYRMDAGDYSTTRKMTMLR